MHEQPVTTAEYYETYWSHEGFCPRGHLSPELEILLNRWIPASGRCVDIGCGDGRTTGLWLRWRGCQYLGLDIAENAVAAARQLGLEAQRIDDATQLPLEDASCDVALCIEVLEHLFAPQEAAAEALRILKPGGFLLLTVPNVAYWRRRLELSLLGRWNPLGDELAVERPWRDPHLRFFTAAALRRMLQTVGFRPVYVGGLGGSLLRDLPLFGRPLRGRLASRLYRVAERGWPSLLGYNLYAIAFKDGG